MGAQTLFYHRQLNQLARMTKQDQKLNPGAVCLILDKLNDQGYPILGVVETMRSDRHVELRYLTKRGNQANQAIASRSVQGLSLVWDPTTDLDQIETDVDLHTSMVCCPDPRQF